MIAEKARNAVRRLDQFLRRRNLPVLPPRVECHVSRASRVGDFASEDLRVTIPNFPKTHLLFLECSWQNATTNLGDPELITKMHIQSVHYFLCFARMSAITLATIA